MIKLENIWKSFRTGSSRKWVAKGIDLSIGNRTSIALLGRNGAGKSTLLKMIAGTVNPELGNITRTSTISWPVGFAGSFHPDLTGAQNVRFVARIYGADTRSLVSFVEDFAELGGHYHMPFRTYSSGMRSRLAFGVSMGIPFDTYLVDEITAVGDAAFRRKSTQVFRARLAKSGAVVVTHSMPMVRELCTTAAVLENGCLEIFNDVDKAIARHEQNMAA